PHRSIVRMLLKSFAYKHQESLLPDNWQIEHILPQRWQNSFFPDIEPKIVNEMIEHIGNKTPFERKLNIVASNGYFQKKQSEYNKSEIEVTKILVTSITSDWILENIEKRDTMVTNDILCLLTQWETEYANYNVSSISVPTAEELVLIKKFKEQGWVK
ncbi:MAG: HNH endonuclease, partial [Alphaproteobacteria bacterium]|nr:HNH endonuclease [Alphaproteobacteria bacterium]